MRRPQGPRPPRPQVSLAPAALAPQVAPGTRKRGSAAQLAWELPVDLGAALCGRGKRVRVCRVPATGATRPFLRDKDPNMTPKACV